MIKYLSVLLFITGCGSVKITDMEVCAELPYSKDGYCKRVVSNTTRRIPKEKWAKEKRTMILIPYASYKELKIDTYDACYTFKCQQPLDSVGEFFEEIDKAVSALP